MSVIGGLTEKQVLKLIETGESLAAYFSAQACRVIAEWPDDVNLVEHLDNLPVSVVREFDEAIADIQYSMMDGGPDLQKRNEQKAKYEAAMAEQRNHQ